jgi:hypothetical protein
VRTRAVAGALLAGVLLAGCGAPSPDLFVVERTGSVPGARLTLVVDDGGFVRCNGGERLQISSEQLIDAREIERAISGDEEKPGPATRDLKLAPQPGSVVRFDVRTEAGSVSFADNSTGQPQDFYRLAQLTRTLAKEVCGLPR